MKCCVLYYFCETKNSTTFSDRSRTLVSLFIQFFFINQLNICSRIVYTKYDRVVFNFVFFGVFTLFAF